MVFTDHARLGPWLRRFQGTPKTREASINPRAQDSRSLNVFKELKPWRDLVEVAEGPERYSSRECFHHQAGLLQLVDYNFRIWDVKYGHA